jgi:hypothetical protein
MANESSTIVQRLWNYCNVLRDDGMSYGDYVEQLTYLLFPWFPCSFWVLALRFPPLRATLIPCVVTPSPDP